MKVIDNIAELRATLRKVRSNSKNIGLIPTMGALHDGHLKLIDQSINQNDFTICSIFVNPTQFNSDEDLDKYPRQLSNDIDLLKKVECDLVFAPSVKEMYPTNDVLKMSFGELGNVLEGEFRPGHFSGVGIVVSKLFNIVNPDKAYFGQKDLQQVAVIKKLVSDLNFETIIVVVPTVREDSGLAMSSRNLRLTEEEKIIAANLYKSLVGVKDKIDQDFKIEEALEKAKERLSQVDGFDLEYIDVVDSLTMQKIGFLEDSEEISICGVAYVNGIRIIDNIYLKQLS